MKPWFFIVISAISFTSAHAWMRLDHEFGSIYVQETDLCIKDRFFQLKNETYSYCKEDVFSRKTGHCTNAVAVIPRREIISTEKVCVQKNPAKNALDPCLKFEDRQVILPSRYDLIVETGNSKRPSQKVVHVEVPACNY